MQPLPILLQAFLFLFAGYQVSFNPVFANVFDKMPSYLFVTYCICLKDLAIPKSLLFDYSFSRKELKIAYRKKALETHPDTGGTKEAFRQVHAAFKTLSGLTSY